MKPRLLSLWAKNLGRLTSLAVGAAFIGCSPEPEVVAYCAQDQVYAEPIFADFTRTTGIRVRAVYDSEAVKTVGLANRILAESPHPVADVFWGNEEFHTRRLAAAGAFRATNGWIAFGQRSRRLTADPSRQHWLGPEVTGLTNAALRGRVSLAAPWFGSTATHFAALRAIWGAGRWQAWCRALAANQVFLEEGNSQVTQRVARGDAWVGLTDSDDLQAARREGLNLVAGPALWPIRNTVAVLREAPHPVAAQALFLFLQSAAVHQALAKAGALEVVPPDATTTPAPPWEVMLHDFDLTLKELREFFQP